MSILSQHRDWDVKTVKNSSLHRLAFYRQSFSSTNLASCQSTNKMTILQLSELTRGVSERNGVVTEQLAGHRHREKRVGRGEARVVRRVPVPVNVEVCLK